MTVTYHNIEHHIDRRRYKKALRKERNALRAHTYKRAKQFVWRDEAFFAEQEERYALQTATRCDLADP